MAIQKFIHKSIHQREREYFNLKFTQNTTPRILEDKKVSGYLPSFKVTSQRSIRYSSIKIYNSLPSKLTKIEQKSRFKNLLKRYNRNSSNLPK